MKSMSHQTNELTEALSAILTQYLRDTITMGVNEPLVRRALRTKAIENIQTALAAEIEKRFDESFLGRDPEFGQEYTGGTPYLIKQFIAQELTTERQALSAEIEKLVKEEKEHDGHSTDEDMWCYTCEESIESGTWSNNIPYNQAIRDVLALLKGDKDHD